VGIAGRLAGSFAAVAVLAVSANLLIQRDIAVVETTRLDRARHSPAPDSAPPAPSAAARELQSRAAEARAGRALSTRAAVAAASIDRFTAALERYDRAIEMRLSADSGTAAGAVRSAARDLGLAANALQSRLATPTGELPVALASFQRAGEGCVESADAHRSALQQYQAHLDAMDARIGVSIGGAFRIFGRVLARQSLVQLRSDMEELQRRFTDVAAQTEDAGALAALAASEQTFSDTFQANKAGFTRSEGAPWVRHMHDDIAQLIAARSAGAAAGSALRDEIARFSSARARLVAALPEAAALPEVAAASIAAPAKPRPPVMSALLAPRLPPASASAPVEALTSTTTTTRMEPHKDPRIAWITAAAVLVWLAISVWTVRSILVPVGRMIEATRKLAAGDADVHVSRGGMKEIDALAAAFNRMAVQLRAARRITQDYRHTLETQVEQRTRLLQHLAEHDPLTLLANRRQFFILLERSLEGARATGCRVAVFFIDLDNFKNLNDGMGHAFGDRVLISVAQRLEETVQGLGFASRLGGDEFTVVHHEVDSPQAALTAGRRLVEAFERPLDVEGRDLTVSVSVGASLYPDHAQAPESLLSAADVALFRAKALGRKQLAIFTPELLETASRKFTTEQGIRRALELDEFELVFQPEVSLDTLRVDLVEALVRWRLPDGRLAMPDEFLPVTEESGLIAELGGWVLRRAFEKVAAWHRGPWPQARMAINVSPRQLLDRGFADRVAGLLREFRLPARCIELELTESVLQTGAATIDCLHLLRALDVAIALDDFGTGYSSLASLERLPLSRIKLDRTLIAGIDHNARAAAIATALIRLCESLGIEVTAEGVERDSQFACLAAHRSLHLQGYLLAPPLAEGDVLRVIRDMPQALQDLLLSMPAAPSRPEASTRCGPQDLTRGNAKR